MWRPEQLYIVDSTLREGQQSAGAALAPSQRLALALRLEAFGADFIELTNPLSSRSHRESCIEISSALRTSKALAHIRCCQEDAEAALDTGVSGLNLFIGVSALMRAAHGLGSLSEALRRATETLCFIKDRAPHMELRLSMEDAFRTPMDELLLVAAEARSTGTLVRLGLADTTGCATPMQVASTVSALREAAGMDVEFHGHNDTGCATANSYAAFCAGASYIDASVLGLGERNGITPLAELIARMQVSCPTAISKYDMAALGPLHEAVASAFGVQIPSNHCIVGRKAFTHKAGVHISAVNRIAASYESLDPSAFGLKRLIDGDSEISGRKNKTSHPLQTAKGAGCPHAGV